LVTADLFSAHNTRTEGGRAGRPTTAYILSPAGDHLFPKAYDELAVELIDTLGAALGPEALRQVLTSFTDENVRQWQPQLQDKSLLDRLEALKGVYLENDPYMELDWDEDSSELRLVERNCPFLNVANRRPALCSVTVSTLSRLLGHRVVREKRFQNGDGRCVFHVRLDQPLNPPAFRFAFEEEMNGRS
jgi:predicted ArsR family transcriptional regulator